MAFSAGLLREFGIVIAVRRLRLCRCDMSGLVLCITLPADGSENCDDDEFFHGRIEFKLVLAMH